MDKAKLTDPGAILLVSDVVVTAVNLVLNQSDFTETLMTFAFPEEMAII